MSDIESPVVGDGKVVLIKYTLSDASGEVLDRTDEEPMGYLHGANNILPGLEKKLTGHAVGDRIEAVLPPEDAYGERTGPGPQPVPREHFPPGIDIEVGMPFAVEDESGNVMSIWVTDVEDDRIFIDANHPLAGQTLHFEVEVVGVRNATPDELSHGHTHGPGGHHH
jgi:FKBP-type peptidyl-prolyl cis-trans isomerase SlyD